MHEIEVGTERVMPLLAGFAVRRTSGGPEIPGHYCEVSRMWMVEVDGRRTPIISATAELADLVTKTAAQMESDDETRPRPRGNAAGGAGGFPDGLSERLLELATKTETRREADDR